jgi:putative ABC transport system permease protein
VPGVQAVSAASGLPLQNGVTFSVTFEEQEVLTRYLNVDADYLSVMGMHLVDGRDFRATGDSSAVLVNETAARLFGLADKVGQTLDDPLADDRLIGIVSDFHVASLHEPIMPALLYLSSGWENSFFPGAFVLRLASNDPGAMLERLEGVWNTFMPDSPFTYHFADELWYEKYQAEERLGRLTNTFALLAVLIACLGLFGLAAFTAERRTKEIGIRKVLGASTYGLVALLSSEFVRLVALAFAVAAPVAYLVMERWLSGFAYRVDLGFGVFAAAGVVALLVALLTVSGQAVRAALADPVESLRYE